MLLVRSVLLVVVAQGVGCGPGSGSEPDGEVCIGDPATSTGGTGTPTSGLCPDHPEVDACCCFDPYPVGVNPHTVVCGQHFICQEVVIPEDGFPNGARVEDCVPAIDCALEALRSGEIGTIRWRRYIEYGYEEVLLHLLGDGTAFRSGVFSQDLNYEIYPVERYDLEDTEVFADCAASPAVDERLACLLSALSGDPLELCAEGHAGSDL